ncbi:unnamed protein product [Amoebophrya sp. A120]|nr:unnamed protein product [Amoebophrya sp. A120]|eukprot:GSA120T00020297001.1
MTSVYNQEQNQARIIAELQRLLAEERRQRYEVQERLDSQDALVKEDLRLFRDVQQEASVDREFRQHLEDRISVLATLGDRAENARKKALYHVFKGTTASVANVLSVGGSHVKKQLLAMDEPDLVSDVQATTGGAGISMPPSSATTAKTPLERVEHCLTRAETSFAALSDVNILRTNRLYEEELGKLRKEGKQLLKTCQNVMAHINDLGRALVKEEQLVEKAHAKRISVRNMGKRPFWQGEFMGMNQTLQNFSANISSFSESLHFTERMLLRFSTSKRDNEFFYDTKSKQSSTSKASSKNSFHQNNSAGTPATNVGTAGAMSTAKLVTAMEKGINVSTHRAHRRTAELFRQPDPSRGSYSERVDAWGSPTKRKLLSQPNLVVADGGVSTTANSSDLQRSLYLNGYFTTMNASVGGAANLASANVSKTPTTVINGTATPVNVGLAAQQQQLGQGVTRMSMQGSVVNGINTATSTVQQERAVLGNSSDGGAPTAGAALLGATNVEVDTNANGDYTNTLQLDNTRMQRLTTISSAEQPFVDRPFASAHEEFTFEPNTGAGMNKNPTLYYAESLGNSHFDLNVPAHHGAPHPNSAGTGYVAASEIKTTSAPASGEVLAAPGGSSSEVDDNLRLQATTEVPLFTQQRPGSAGKIRSVGVAAVPANSNSSSSSLYVTRPGVTEGQTDLHSKISSTVPTFDPRGAFDYLENNSSSATTSSAHAQRINPSTTGAGAASFSIVERMRQNLTEKSKISNPPSVVTTPTEEQSKAVGTTSNATGTGSSFKKPLLASNPFSSTPAPTGVAAEPATAVDRDNNAGAAAGVPPSQMNLFEDDHFLSKTPQPNGTVFLTNMNKKTPNTSGLALDIRDFIEGELSPEKRPSQAVNTTISAPAAASSGVEQNESVKQFAETFQLDLHSASPPKYQELLGYSSANAAVVEPVVAAGNTASHIKFERATTLGLEAADRSSRELFDLQLPAQNDFDEP